MELNEYQELANRTRNKDLSQRDELLNYSLGVGEAGEVQNAVKKWIYHGHDEAEALNKILDESGDLLWNLSQLLRASGFTLQDAAEYNIEKLRRRYPDGFSQEASRNRKV